MTENCKACATPGGATNPILTLREIGPDRPRKGLLHLCQACLTRRTRAHWSPEVGGTRVRDALLAPPHHPGRFTYLQDPAGNVYLTRLRSAWVHAHEVSPPRAPLIAGSGPRP